MGAITFEAQVQPRVCDCRGPAKMLAQAKTRERAIERIKSYWYVYIGFFGDQTLWLNFDVVDIRDGTVVWRNGRQLKGEDRQDGTLF